MSINLNSTLYSINKFLLKVVFFWNVKDRHCKLKKIRYHITKDEIYKRGVVIRDA